MPVKTKRVSLFCRKVFRVFDRGLNNRYVGSTPKNTDVPQNKVLWYRLVLTGTIHSEYDLSYGNKTNLYFVFVTLAYGKVEKEVVLRDRS